MNNSTELFQKVLSLWEQVQASIGECIETVVALWELVYFSFMRPPEPPWSRWVF